jgi:predicted MFS family arabinose efflux permease
MGDVATEGNARARRAILIASIGGFFGFYMELSVFPVLAAHPYGSFAAGALTFSAMVATVSTQFVTPRLVGHIAPRWLLFAGIVLIGLPTLLLFASESLAMLVGKTLVRGAGFGLLTVLGAALIAAYAPAGGRGSSLGAYGLAAAVGTAVGPPVGLALLRYSPDASYLAGALVPVIAACALLIPMPHAAIGADRDHTPLRRRASSLRPTAPILVFVPTAMVFGVAFTYIPLLSVQSTTGTLICFGVTMALGRLLGGHLLDRHFAVGKLLIRFALATAAGLVALGVSADAAADLGAALAGLGTGAILTITLGDMLDRAGSSGLAHASRTWNMILNTGIGVGALLLGAASNIEGAAGVFVVAAALVATSTLAAIAVSGRAAPVRARS